MRIQKVTDVGVSWLHCYISAKVAGINHARNHAVFCLNNDNLGNTVSETRTKHVWYDLLIDICWRGQTSRGLRSSWFLLSAIFLTSKEWMIGTHGTIHV